MLLQWAVKLRVIVITLLHRVFERVRVCVLPPVFILAINYRADGEPTLGRARAHTHIHVHVRAHALGVNLTCAAYLVS